MTREDLNAIRETFIGGMKQNFKQDGTIYPVSIIVSGNGKLTIIKMPFADNEEKQLVFSGLRRLIVELDAVAIFLINEAWTVVRQEDYSRLMKEMRESGKQIKDLDDKKEVAMMIFETKLTTETIIFDLDKEKLELTNRISGTVDGGNFSNFLQ